MKDKRNKKFLPPDIDEIVSKSSSPFILPPTKKELYMLLSHSHIPLDGGKLGFFLDKRTGKKCFRIASSELVFSERDDSDGMYMEQELICSRRRGVAVVKTMDGRKFDIFGRISSEKLSKETHYSTYLVHRLSPKHGHCDLSFKGVCRFVDNEGRDEAESRVWPYYVPSTVSRDDGWLETKIGSFFNVGGNLGDVEPCLFSVMLQCHRFLSVLGLEFRAGTTSGGMADWGFCEEFLEEKAKF